MQTTDCPDANDIIAECDLIKQLLLEKNRAYGSSAFTPIEVFSKLGALAAIDVRIDDKLSRLKQAKDFKEDTELDLIGYLVLRRICKKRLERENKAFSKDTFQCYLCGKQASMVDGTNWQGRLFCPTCSPTT